MTRLFVAERNKHSPFYHKKTCVRSTWRCRWLTRRYIQSNSRKMAEKTTVFQFKKTCKEIVNKFQKAHKTLSFVWKKISSYAAMVSWKTGSQLSYVRKKLETIWTLCFFRKYLNKCLVPEWGQCFRWGSFRSRCSAFLRHFLQGVPLRDGTSRIGQHVRPVTQLRTYNNKKRCN